MRQISDELLCEAIGECLGQTRVELRKEFRAEVDTLRQRVAES